MKIKRAAAVCIAAALLITAATGCTAVKRYTVESDDEAYKRELYPDDYFSPFDDIGDNDDAEDEVNDETVTEKTVTEEKKSDENKKKDKKKNKDSDKSKAESKEEKSSAASSQSASSRAAEPRSSAARTSTSRSVSSRVNSSTVSSKTSSTDSDTDSEKDTDILPSPIGSFSAYDTAYYTKKGIIFPGEDEAYVRKLMGEPNEEFFSEDGLEKSLTFDDCVMSFIYDEADEEFILYRVQIPLDSMYETSKFMGTEMPLRKVLRTYGTPTKILKIEDDEWSAASTADSGSDTDTQPKASDDSPSAQTWIYLYMSSDSSLVFITQHNEVIGMEYRFERRANANEGDR